MYIRNIIIDFLGFSCDACIIRIKTDSILLAQDQTIVALWYSLYVDGY